VLWNDNSLPRLYSQTVSYIHPPILAKIGDITSKAYRL
jgi:hypothetical protein